MTYLSPHFSLEELTQSQTAARLGLDNTPVGAVLDALRFTAERMEWVRTLLGDRPIFVSSGYRSFKVNEAVGGSKSSQHMKGEAVDFTCPRFGPPERVVRAIVDSSIPYDQVIVEFGRWVHISFTKDPRRQALVIDHGGTSVYA